MSKTSKTIQAKMSELNELIAWFDGEDFSLEEAVTQFEKAEKLAAEIDHDLRDLKNNIVVVKEKFGEA